MVSSLSCSHASINPLSKSRRRQLSRDYRPSIVVRVCNKPTTVTTSQLRNRCRGNTATTGATAVSRLLQLIVTKKTEASILLRKRHKSGHKPRMCPVVSCRLPSVNAALCGTLPRKPNLSMYKLIAVNCVAGQKLCTRIFASHGFRSWKVASELVRTHLVSCSPLFKKKLLCSAETTLLCTTAQPCVHTKSSHSAEVAAKLSTLVINQCSAAAKMFVLKAPTLT